MINVKRSCRPLALGIASFGIASFGIATLGIVAAQDRGASPAASDANAKPFINLHAGEHSALRRQLNMATLGTRVASTASLGDEVFWEGFESCGDGVVEAGEACDRADLGGATCASEGYADGTLGCTRQCTFDTTQCGPSVCQVAACNTDSDCGGPACGPCFFNACLGYIP
ncbi:MAG TPA: hypothetical protein VLK26_11285 [Rudaea sp.]|nr:hypothetical protein [Rudaea sp.]